MRSEGAQTLMQLGAQRLSEGRNVEAADLLIRALAVSPDSPIALANLGAAMQASGRWAEAASWYERALHVAPGMVEAQFGLAGCLQALGRREEAEGAYKALLDADPAHPEANCGLATVLEKLGRPHEAESRYRAALAADPDFAEASYALGSLLARRGALEDAVVCFEQALDVDPDYAAARAGLGRTLLGLERDEEAMAALQAALAIDPGQADAQCGMGVALNRKHRQEEAIACFRAALRRDPDHIEALVGLATALLSTGGQDEAVAIGRRAVALRPDHAPAASALATALAEVGELQEGLDHARRAFDLAPERPEFAYNLSTLTTVTPDDGFLAALEAVAARADRLSQRESCWLHFALAKALDDVGERDRGFDHLLKGAALKRAMIRYDESAALGTLDRIRHVFTGDLLAARTNVGASSDAPVFIVGMPRSGTSLVEQILASHPAVFGAGERPDLMRAVRRLHAERVGGAGFPQSVRTAPAARLRAMGAEYVTALLALAPGAARITDKMPANFALVGLIRLILPNARIIHMVRDPVDTCLSCFSKLFAAEQAFTYDLAELGRYHRAYQRLMDHWRAVLPPGAMLDVAYEAVVGDVEAEARRIVEHCGLPWDAACLRFYETRRAVHTASVTQVRRPIYRGSIGRWRPAPDKIRPLLEGLEGASANSG